MRRLYPDVDPYDPQRPTARDPRKEVIAKLHVRQANRVAAGRDGGIGNLWDVITHPGDDLKAVWGAITHPADAVADVATWAAGVGVGGVAGAIIGGVAGIFVMNPALGAQLGLQMGMTIGEGAAEVDPTDVQAAAKAGVVAVYDAAGKLIAGDPNNPNHVIFTPPEYASTPEASAFISKAIANMRALASGEIKGAQTFGGPGSVETNAFLLPNARVDLGERAPGFAPGSEVAAIAAGVGALAVAGVAAWRFGLLRRFFR